MSTERPSVEVEPWLDALSASVAREFEATRHLLTFDEFVRLVALHPVRFARSSPQYLLDAIRSFGTAEVSTARGDRTRHLVFDAPFAQGEDRVIGNEEVQRELVRILENFVRERRVNRLVLIHGPNGSAKSSFVACLSRALEAYSRTDDGALYRFHWVFPSKAVDNSRIGFGGRGSARAGGSYALLDESEIDARIASDMNESPLLLIPREQRASLLVASLPGEPGFVLSDAVRLGDLGHRSRQIFDALLTAHRGDLRAVYRHVQVERFYISRRYRCGAVTVEPQLRVDAQSRQVTADRSLAALPAVLQSQAMFELSGPLVEGNRGIVEFNDLLKRPMDLNKYLLATSEKATVSLESSELHLDTLLVATSNETYLDAFKGQADWPSYKGRLELVRMPYLLDHRAEQRIYDELLTQVAQRRAVAPHLTHVLALWAVLTRLRRPRAEVVPKAVQPVVAELTPLAKAQLYADDVALPTLTAEQRQQLVAAVPRLAADASEGVHYEGRYGASPREMKTVLLNVLNATTEVVTPLQLLAELRQLIRDTSVYEWLRLEPDGEYHRPDRFVTVVRDCYLDLIEREFREATGLIDETEYARVLDRYVHHVTHWLRNERLTDSATGAQVQPDAGMMADIEKILGRDVPERDFRSQLVARIAAFRIDHPDAPVELPRVIPHHFDRLRDHYYASKRRSIERLLRAVLGQLGALDVAPEASDRAAADAAIAAMTTRFGHPRAAIAEPLGLLLRERFAPPAT
jgi:predicted Ser/Thr protein kinase